MGDGILPRDGTAPVGSVSLPAGRRLNPVESGDAVAWVTSEPVDDAGRLWLELSGAHAETGLAPVLLVSCTDVAESGPCGEDFGFFLPSDTGLADRMSARDVLAADWFGDEHDEYLARAAAPFGADFPGLAPAGDTRLPRDVLERAVTSQPPAYLGLVAAGRPADVPPIVGWSVFGSDAPGGPEARALEIATVLRSWEDRYGARLLRMGNDVILRVLVERPPGTVDAAQRARSAGRAGGVR